MFGCTRGFDRRVERQKVEAFGDLIDGGDDLANRLRPLGQRQMLSAIVPDCSLTSSMIASVFITDCFPAIPTSDARWAESATTFARSAAWLAVLSTSSTVVTVSATAVDCSRNWKLAARFRRGFRWPSWKAPAQYCGSEP